MTMGPEQGIALGARGLSELLRPTGTQGADPPRVPNSDARHSLSGPTSLHVCLPLLADCCATNWSKFTTSGDSALSYTRCDAHRLCQVHADYFVVEVGA